ncbi:MAG: hypothetical protein A2498_04780 [Lentisphaerae bacterium RIFOXYC12_FULL_60_16]|nr:MAG: hypothetical protein A2498_04780 [Lentisphaerae bacterium RIFOXYC12_FULL_60_16]OGV77722.1 MAG: hypothetical protein A2340_11085 [Lentisphaerae bacterium RIFOXYB12_FULL_60_10]
MELLIGIGIGSVMGLLSGLLGIGGGTIAIPGMMYLLKMPTHLAMGTSLAVIIPVAISGTYKHMLNKNVDFKVAIGLAIGGIVFAYIGAWLQTHVPELMLKRIFGLFIIVLGLNLVLAKPRPATPAPASIPPVAATAQADGVQPLSATK